MNHIVRLQTHLGVAQAEIEAEADAIQESRAHLGSSKLAGVDAVGSRKDWIATSDVWFADTPAKGTPATPTSRRRPPVGTTWPQLT